MDESWKECSLTLIPDKSTLLKNCRITLSSSVLYTGKKLIPLINIDNGTVFLIKGIDYTLTFANNKNPGTATVIIKGKGIYTGKVKKTFRIVPPAPKWMTAARVPGRNFVKLTWKKVAGASGYVIQRRSRSESRWVVRKVITKGTTTAYTDINAQKGITWSYRICAYSRSGKRKIYSSWSTAYWKI